MTAARKAHGVYYTPPGLVAHVIGHTLGPLFAGRTPAEVAAVRILDPACGDGAFLLGAYQYLLDWYQGWYVADGPARHPRCVCRATDGTWRLTAAERQRILRRHIYGVEIDGQAAEAARRALLSEVGERGASAPRGKRPDSDASLGGLTPPARQEGDRILDRHIRTGNALVGPEFDAAGLDWAAAFPAVLKRGGFTVILGNPPWGQKAVCKDAALKRYLWQRYPSSAGIFDLFRPFVELGVRLTAAGGRFGMVLPDVVLLKDYPPTRRLLLDELTLERIDWWGRAFAGATIDTATLIGRREPAPPGHRVAVAVHDAPPLAHAIPQADFRANPRLVFNLHLTPPRRRLLERLEGCPRLGDFYEVHEGVHSGNLRAELFVPTAVDASCRELLFGRDEIAPYRLDWQGRFVRLAALPRRKTPACYANLGRPEWYERDKLLVRRTGDRILAAVDRQRRFASNNFFLVFPRREMALDLDGLCALLNSRFMTGYFRTVEPRRGRAFAELKIKHLCRFPLPQLEQAGSCQALNELGRQRCLGRERDAAIDALVQELFGLSADEWAALGDLAGRIE